ncbi:MAG: DUF222 domain-containing protein, partial [Candidatus Nanopelagicales bacterium]
MTITDLPTDPAEVWVGRSLAPTDPGRLLADFQAAAEALLACDPGEWSLDELQTSIPVLHKVSNQSAAVQTRVLASFDARGGAQIAGARTTGDWLAKTTRIPSAHAGWWVHTARALRDHLPASAAALGDGDIDLDHVRAIRSARRELGDNFEVVEDQIAAFARKHCVRDLRGFLDLLIQNYARDTHEKNLEDERDRRRAKLSPGLHGWWHLTGFLDPAGGAALAAVLDIYATPTGPDDSRSAGNRTADALAEIATRALDTIDRPSGLGHITLTLTPEQLDTGLGVAWPTGMLASYTDIRTASCSAKVTYVVGIPVDGVHWQPLAVGFAERYATKAQRAALAVRDGAGCIHPGCTVPAHRCIAHHIQHWDQGGPTDLSNLVLICVFHHRRVHLGRLSITQTPEGRYTTTTNRAPPLP